MVSWKKGKFSRSWHLVFQYVSGLERAGQKSRIFWQRQRHDVDSKANTIEGPHSDSTVLEVKIALVIYPITVYTIIGLTTYCIVTFEPLQALSFLRWGPQLEIRIRDSSSARLRIESQDHAEYFCLLRVGNRLAVTNRSGSLVFLHRDAQHAQHAEQTFFSDLMNTGQALFAYQ